MTCWNSTQKTHEIDHRTASRGQETLRIVGREAAHQERPSPRAVSATAEAQRRTSAPHGRGRVARPRDGRYSRVDPGTVGVKSLRLVAHDEALRDVRPVRLKREPIREPVALLEVLQANRFRQATHDVLRAATPPPRTEASSLHANPTLGLRILDAGPTEPAAPEAWIPCRRCFAPPGEPCAWAPGPKRDPAVDFHAIRERDAETASEMLEDRT